jgi:5'-nucleotidase
VASSRRLRALITNDDGIDSPGLWALAAAAAGVGFDVVVAAPHVDASGTGSSVKADRDDDGHVRVHPREIPGLPGVPAYGVEGPPAFIVTQALRGWFEPVPDIVLAGINWGANTGHAILHSGTVGAALAAGLGGVRGLAVSLDTRWPPPDNPNWDTAAGLIPEVVELLLQAPEATVLTLNVPDRPAADIGPLRETTLAAFGSVAVRISEDAGRDGQVLKASFARRDDALEPGTDLAELRAGHPTLTAIASVNAIPGLLPVAETA